EYIAPDMGGVRTATEVLEKDEEAWYRSAFRLLEAEGDAQRTATEALLSRRSGLAAALGLVASAMEELENAALFLSEQALSDDPSRWTSAVTYDKDYAGVSLDLGNGPAEVG